MAQLLKNKQIKQYLRHLQNCQSCNGKDPEFGHKAADEVLCGVLEAMGYSGIVAAYRGVEKLYADTAR